MISNKSETSLPDGGQFLLYEAEDGRIKIDVRLADETVWLTQQHIAELFQTTVPNISMHIRNVYDEGELSPQATVQKFLTVRREGNRDVQRNLEYYNLDMIISVGYRVKSHVATSIDYDPTLEISIQFFKTVQNKMHWAITGQTAAEIIHARADADKANMGLTNWRGAKVRKQDVTVAKNYLNEEELAALNNLVEQYLIFAEGQAMRRTPMHMADWIRKLDAFFNINDRKILTHAGKISHDMACQLANDEYGKFTLKRIAEQDLSASDFDNLIHQLPDQKNQK